MATETPPTPADQPQDNAQIELSIATDGSTVSDSTINVGDVVGRDKIVEGDEVHGDKVEGDKVMGDIVDSEAVAIGAGAVATSIKNFFFGDIHYLQQQGVRPPAEEKTLFEIEPDRELDLLRVRVKRVLDSYETNELNIGKAMICLEFEDCSSLVNYPGKKERNRKPVKSAISINPETRISEVFVQANGYLLLLGGPGAGKSTLLINLAQSLVSNRETKLPIIVKLSNWSQELKTLSDLVKIQFDEDKLPYNEESIDNWLANGKLSLLLDGLDELESAIRKTCIRAINQFHEDCASVQIVVCSRNDEYEEIKERLNLDGAVQIKPLNDAQINSYLESSNSFSTLQLTLRRESSLRLLARSPLSLAVMSNAYSNINQADLTLGTFGHSAQEQLFNDYIKWMFVRYIEKSLNAQKRNDKYSILHTMEWLNWIAKYLTIDGREIFSVERLQPSLASSLSRANHIFFVLLFTGLLYGLLSGSILGLMFGLFSGLLFGSSVITVSGNLQSGDFSWLFALIPSGILAGFLIGIVLGILYMVIDIIRGKFLSIDYVDNSVQSPKTLLSNLYAITYWVFMYGLFFGVFLGSPGALFGGIVGGLSFGLLSNFQRIHVLYNPIFSGKEVPKYLINFVIRNILKVNFLKGRERSWKQFDQSLRLGLRFGLISGFIVGFLGKNMSHSSTGMLNIFLLGLAVALLEILSDWQLNRLFSRLFMLTIIGHIIIIVDNVIGRPITQLLNFALNVFLYISSFVDAKAPLTTVLTPQLPDFIIINEYLYRLYELFFYGLGFQLIFSIAFGLLFGLVGTMIGKSPANRTEKQEIRIWQRIIERTRFGIVCGLTITISFWIILLLLTNSSNIVAIVTQEGVVKLNMIWSSSLYISMLSGLLSGVIFGFFFQSHANTNVPEVEEIADSSNGIKHFAKIAIVRSTWVGILSGIALQLFAVFSVDTNSVRNDLLIGSQLFLLGGCIGGIIGGLQNGYPTIKHILIRAYLFFQNYMPWDYFSFLDYSTKLIFIRKLRGGYKFQHRLIMQHFAALDKMTIKGISVQIENQINNSDM